MTEPEWLTSESAQPMLDFLLRRANARKLRLFAVACCRRVEHLLLTAEARNAIEVAERHADGRSDPAEVAAAMAVLNDDSTADAGTSGNCFVFDRRAEAVATAVSVALLDSEVQAPSGFSRVHFAADRAAFASRHAGQIGEEWSQVVLLRDIFGNPFRPVALAPAWLTTDTLALARGIYDDKAFDRMPILADALQDAGCDSPDVLDHCRGDGPHVRGCWVVDLLLGKA